MSPDPPPSPVPPPLSSGSCPLGLLPPGLLGMVLSPSLPKETLAEKVRSSIATTPKSLIVVVGSPGICPRVPVPCTIRTGNDSGSAPGGAGLGPGPYLSTVVTPA